MNSWINSLMFAVGLEVHKRRKEEQVRQKFLSERRENLAAAVAELADLTGHLVEVCGPIGLDKSFVEDTKLAPFYAMGEVLSAQGEVYPEQEPVLKIMFNNLNPRYNYAQFTEAVIHRAGVYSEYRDVVNITEEACGSLWLTLFELIYRSREIDICQKIMDQMHLIVINFAYLGDPHTLLPEAICKRIMDGINYHVNAHQQTQYIHAIMLLQNMLLERKRLAISDHLFQRDDDIVHEERRYYVFRVYQKHTYEFCGKYAVREIAIRDGKLDYEQDGDKILVWNADEETYDVFYQERP